MDTGQVLDNCENVTAVTSVGSSWIICRSKSHSGRIYYFNTLTGEAAWNLSDSEIEKAKKRTRVLQSQCDNEFESCPEPKEPPVDISTNVKTARPSEPIIQPSRVYNKQIINNQFPKQAFPPFTGYCTNCNACMGQSVIDASGANFSVPHNCNPNVWALPPNHQIMIAPPIHPPQLNQPQVNVTCNIEDREFPVQNTTLPLSRRFNTMPPTRPNVNGQQRTNSPFIRKFNKNINPNDLRQKLSAKRSFSWNQSFENIGFQGNKTNGNTSGTFIQIIKPNIEAVTPSDGDDKWLQENASIQGTLLVLNVTPLKDLVISDERSSCWYVVADMHVLVNNINLLKVVVNSDEQCQLLVPDDFMAELQDRGRLGDPQMCRAHHVLQILSQLFATGSAVIGKDPVKEEDRLQIFDFCMKLTKQVQNVVLLSNNHQLGKYKNISNFTVLNVLELKKILTSDKESDPGRHSVCPLRAIKITVPNSINTEEMSKRANMSKAEEKFNIGNKNHVDSNITEYFSQRNEVNRNLKNGDVISKSTKSIGVQTDIIHQSFPQKIDRSTITECNVSCNDTESDSSKRRGIQLKRNLSHQAPLETSTEKRQFKWRRRKPLTCNATDHDIKGDMMKFDPISTCSASDMKDTDRETALRQSGYDEPNDSSETGSSCYVQNNVQANIVIEETSTSGIISNSASNVDSESMHSVKPNMQSYNQCMNEEKEKCKCAMFEVESPAMEEYLKMRCDEWISRFVQIMEEVLTQILQQDPPFFHRSLPPPWSIHEATECIKKKFEDDSDVNDAANKLTSFLFKISDGRGKIKAELKPGEFMEMYSYGVYLVDSLQSILSTCEDLQTAADSLARLLNDIMDPNLDVGQVDSFMETSEVPDANVTQQDISTEKEQPTQDEVLRNEDKQMRSPAASSDKNLRKYNLRSAQKKPAENEADTPVKFIRKIDIESTFFSSLKLRKNNNLLVNKIWDSSDKGTNDTSHSNKDEKNKSPKIEPKIIRNFSKCFEFEEKLKMKTNSRLDSLYNDGQREEIKMDEFGYYDESFNGDYDYFEDNESVDEMENKSCNEEAGSNLDVNGNDVYNQVLGKFTNKMQEALLDVHSFCEQTRNELCAKPDVSSTRKFEISDKAEKARSHMDVLCKSLNSILCREDNNCENNLKAVLKEVGIHLDNAKCDEYRNVISKYLSQANTLLEAVNVIFQVVN